MCKCEAGIVCKCFCLKCWAIEKGFMEPTYHALACARVEVQAEFQQPRLPPEEIWE